MGSKTNGNKVATANRRKGDVGEAAAWAAFYAKIIAPRIDPVPPEWKTPRQISKFLNMRPDSCANMLRKLEREGRVVPKKFRAKTGNNVKWVKHYRIHDV